MIIDGTGVAASAGAAFFQVNEPGGVAGCTDGLGHFTVGLSGPTPTAVWHIQRAVLATPATPTLLQVTAAADTALTSQETTDILFDLSATRQFATGNFGTQRSVRLIGPTLSAVGASTITQAITLHVGGPTAGTNMTLTNAVAVWAQGNIVFGSTSVFPATTLAQVSLGAGAVAAPTAPGTLALVCPAHTTCSAGVEVNDLWVNAARTLQFSTGALTTQRAVRVDAPTYGFVGASNVTNAATLAISGAPVAGTNCTFLSGSGQGSYALWVQGGGALITGHVSQAGGSAPTAAAGANNGGSPPAPVIGANANDSRGSLTFGSGSAAAAGAQCVVTFNTTYGAAPYVDIMAGNSVTQALGLYISSLSATAFTISSTNAPTSSQANTVYSVYWFVVG